MHKALRIGIIAICLGFIFSSVSVSDAKGQGILGEILRRMDNYNKSLQSLQANMTMVKYDSTLKIADPARTGSVSYLLKTKKRYMRMDMQSPEEYISVIGDEYQLYQPRINRLVYGKTQGSKGSQGVGNILSVMNMSKAQLNANYEATYIAEEQISGGTKTWHIQLSPKTAADFKLADLWIDVDGTVRQSKITQKNNDTTTILITSIKKNPTIKGDTFKLAFPKNVEKVRG
ncbi:MAG: outer membrane lipoprotein carrier protein LolA [Pyrinomonadaceae bacterium]